MKKVISGISVLLALLCACNNEADVTLEEGNIHLVIEEMLSDEKAMLLSGVDNGTLCTSYAIPRLGIPAVGFAVVDGGIVIDSVRLGDFSRPVCGTLFPESNAIAASWNSDSAFRLGEALGEEAKWYNIDMLVSQPKDSLLNPFLDGMITSAIIQGIQSTGTGACLRFAEAGKAVEIAVKESSPRMLSKLLKPGRLNTAADVRSLNGKLRNDWGWKGLLSEWGDRMDTGAAAKEGYGMYLPGKNSQYENILRSIKDTVIKNDILNQRVTEVLEMVVKSSVFLHNHSTELADSCANASLARELAAESMVILENKDYALPVSAGEKIAFFGIGAFDLPDNCKSLNTGFSDVGFKVCDCTTEPYLARLQDFDKRYTELSAKQTGKIAREAAQLADVAIIVAGNRIANETFRKIDGDGQLNPGETAMIKSVCEAFKGKKTILVLRSPLSISSCKDFVDAVVLAWKPSCEWSTALADVLCGNETPSGSLPAAIFKPLGKKETVAQLEYPLGYGLDYSSYSLTEPEIESAGVNDKIKVMVTNTGNHDLIYTLKVLDKEGKLCAFTKTDKIVPGSAVEASVSVKKEEKTIWEFDENGFLTERLEN